jgi:hypothetical protein
MQFSGWIHDPHRGNSVPPSVVWPCFAAPRASLSAAPALSRPNLFSGD